MEEVLKPDLCVIGAGSGGLSVAAAAAQFGVPVVLIEKGRMGGDCLNYGCVPSKALLAAAKRAEAVRTASAFGVEVIEAQLDHRAVHDHVHGIIAAIAPNDSVERFTGLGVRVIQAHASFLDKNTVEAGRVLVCARRFIIATGSMPSIPPIPGLDEIPYFTNETIFDISERMQHLIVLGGGPIGVELAQAHRMLGAHVTMIDAGSFLSRDDPEAVAVILKRLEDAQVALHANTRVERVERAVQGVAVHVQKNGDTEIIKGTHLLVATGRKPTVKSLGLERAGIKFSADGIKVNDHLKTANRRVYAIGDVVGGAQFTHLANYHAGIVIRNALFRLRPRASAALIPHVTFTEPELAQIGMTEAEARKKHRRLRILRWPFTENDRAQAERETDGFIKVISRPNGTILGCTIVGAHAGELLQLWIIAMSKDMRVGDIMNFVLPYPTFSEISKRVALTYYQPTLTKRWLRSIIAFLRRFG
ncbi:MAG: dihydrolipoyl dehydrogenase family protein [Methyloceanibacter sp.]|uniref:dihydrolipoyl dehydrogenase family protein n=1 Tax=Methyloceanibacter sp. TaxID=1965321 RepID=UPI003D9B577D